MNIKSKIKNICLITLMFSTVFFSSCVFGVNEAYESVESLNATFGDTFTLIERKSVNRDLVYSTYSTSVLKKNVTVVTKVLERSIMGPSSIRSYTNYDALKYESESNAKLNDVVKKLYLPADSYESGFDNKLYKIAYSTSQTFDGFFIFRQRWETEASLMADQFISEETANIKIKESALNIKTDSFLSAAALIFTKENLNAVYKISFTDDSGTIKSSYDFTYDTVKRIYDWKEAK